MDGTGIPMRKSETEGRAGKPEDGSAKTREVKLVTVWSAEGRDKDHVPVRDDGSSTYSAAIESAATRDADKEPSEFARRVVREASSKPRAASSSAQRAGSSRRVVAAASGVVIEAAPCSPYLSRYAASTASRTS